MKFINHWLSLAVLACAVMLGSAIVPAAAQTSFYAGVKVREDNPAPQKQSCWSGTAYVTCPSDANAISVQPAPMATFWNYAAPSGGITNTTTAVTIKAAGAAGIRNVVCSLTVDHETLGAVTDLVIRDGAAGTVLFRTGLQTAAQESKQISFEPCIRGTAATLLEVATLTAVTGAVRVNARGFVAK